MQTYGKIWDYLNQEIKRDSYINFKWLFYQYKQFFLGRKSLPNQDSKPNWN